MLAEGAAAQSAPRTTFGFLVGGTAAKVTDVDLSSADVFNGTATLTNRYGFQAGAFLNYVMKDRLSLQPELHYIQKGTVLDIDNLGDASGSLTLSLGYIEVPLLVRMDFGKRDAWRPFITVGPTVAYRAGCEAELKSGGAKLALECESLEDEGVTFDPFEKTDLGISAGVGVAGKLGGLPMLTQLRYGRGFTTIVKNPQDNQSPKNSVFSLVLGISR
jgi:hypothetical protein